METLKVYGYSDRFIYTDGILGCYPEMNVASIQVQGLPGTNTYYSGTMHVATNDGVTIFSIHALYSGSTGNWSFAVAPEEEYDAAFIKNITREVATDDEFSETLLIKVPEGSKLVFDDAHWKNE